MSFTIPGSTFAYSGPLLDGRHLVYETAIPRFHRPVCVSCGQQPFTNFQVHLYLRSYQTHTRSIDLSKPRPLFTGPRGAQVGLESFSSNWLVYEIEDPPDRWQLFARNVVTGRVILLDSPSLEGTPSQFLHADTDGRTVVWQSWAHRHGETVSVIRSYDLASGRRALLLQGGIGRDYFYGYPEISGSRVVLIKEPGKGSNSRIMLEDRATHRLGALTAPGQTNDEPSISGTIVAWVHGSLTVGHTHGLVVANLATGRRVALWHSSALLPRVVAGRYVVFATDYPRASIQIYDARTSRRRTIVAGEAPGYVPGQIVEASGGAILFRMSRPCSSSHAACPSLFTLLSLRGGANHS